MKTQEQKLEEIVQHAIDNGFMLEELAGISADKIQFMVANSRVLWGLKTTDKYFLESSVYGLLFSHEFAKAVFGDELDDCIVGLNDQPLFYHSAPGDSGSDYTLRSWQDGLQKAVVCESPIDYYYSFILPN